MGWSVRQYLFGSIALGMLGGLAACSGGMFFAEREPWRHEAELECLNSGSVKESAGVVRMDPIRGPGMCGADFPLKISALGESGSLGYTDDPRPPDSIPGTPQRWPIARPGTTVQSYPMPPVPQTPAAGGSPYRDGSDAPISLAPPRGGEPPEPYDYRRPYAAPAAAPVLRPPREDFSPEPYERRPLVDARRANPPVDRAPVYDPAMPNGSAQGAASVSGAPVAVSPPATLACPIVSELDRWIANAVQPAALRWFGAPVAEIKQISAYSCRGMNGNPYAHISEHAFGNALDVAAFTLADGRKITVKTGWNGLPEEQGFLRDVQAAACEQFTTVLAPGSNAYHSDHIHVDLMRRHDGHRACNPHAVSGEEVAARAGGRYAGRREREVTGSLSRRWLASKRPSAEDEQRQRALQMAEPGDDEQDD
jgi:hypothetical protein